jgi:hypothetical protein
MVMELCGEQMKYAQHNGSAEVPAQATEQASAASVAGEGAHVPQEKGIFGSAESHARSLSQAAASIPGAIGSVPAAVAGAGALAAGMVSQHRSNSGQPDLASVPEEGRTAKQQPEKAPASENISPNLSSTCTLASGFCTQVTAPLHDLQQRLSALLLVQCVLIVRATQF